MRIITLQNTGLGSFVKQLVPMAVAGLDTLLLTPARQKAELIATFVEDELSFSWGDLPFERESGKNLFRLEERGYIRVSSLNVSGCCIEHVPVVGVYGWRGVSSEQRYNIMAIPAAIKGIESLLVLA